MSRERREQKLQGLSDHDLLIRIDERVGKLDRCMTNHLAHHWTISIAVLSAVMAGIGSLVVSLWLK